MKYIIEYYDPEEIFDEDLFKEIEVDKELSDEDIEDIEIELKERGFVLLDIGKESE